uniref:Oleosin n=1 Tax=Glycine max TaxID=3847 RepID=A0A0R0JP17_SOYBN
MANLKLVPHANPQLSILHARVNTPKLHISMKHHRHYFNPTLRSQQQQPQHVQVHATTTHTPQHHGGEALLAGVPLGAMLLLLSGISLIASLLGLAVATPLFIFFSPLLVPAAFAIGMAVTAVLAAGACGLAGLVLFSWVVNYLRQMPRGTTMMTVLPEQAKRHVADMAEYVGQKTKEVGQDIQTRAHHAQGTTRMTVH